MPSRRITAGSRIPGVVDILDKFPKLIFEAKNAAELSSVINSIVNLSASEKRNLENEMRQTVLERYQTKDFVKANAEIYYQLIKSK